jgi:hypothetical protein
MQLNFHNTHAYPGCAVTVIEDEGTATARGQAVAEFSDGSIATAHYEVIGADEMIVDVAPYTTARQTQISGKRWKIRRENESGRWKVLAKAPQARG